MKLHRIRTKMPNIVKMDQKPRNYEKMKKTLQNYFKKPAQRHLQNKFFENIM